MRCRFITVSDRSYAGVRPDATGPAAKVCLEQAGIETELVIVPDGAEAVQRAVGDAVIAKIDLILTSGGTGVGPRDRTPEGTKPVLELELPGIPERLRSAGPLFAALNRGVAGTAGSSLIVNLPGSPKAAAEGIEILLPMVPHLLDQLAGGDH